MIESLPSMQSLSLSLAAEAWFGTLLLLFCDI